jgi:molybdenum cofactor biosynthesis protein B
MAHAHEAPPLALRVLVVTCSDTRTLDTDSSGKLAEELLGAAGHIVVARLVVPDEPERIAQILTVDAPSLEVDAIVVNGGTGLSRRDRTFDAVDRLLDKRMDGFGELFRMLSFEDIGPAAMLSRACAGLMGACAVFSVPGSTAAVRLALEKLILPELSHVVREARK